MTAGAIKVLLVDDHAVVREGYRRLIEKHAGLDVVAEAGDAPAAYLAYKTAKPDVVVMDISMPGRGGIDAVRQIKQLDPSARILIFTMHCSAMYAQQAFRAGAKGYVTKSSPPQLLIEAVRNVFAAKPALCPEISKVLAASRLAEETSAINDLSPREFEVLRMILEAKSTETIADAFNLSPKTVANYHYNIKSKLGVATDIELVYYCMNHGLVPPLTSDGAT